MSVQQWRHKPARRSTEILHAARYEPGKPLAGVIQVAEMATEGRCAVAYLPRGKGAIGGSTPVLVAACVATWGGETRTDYTVVPQGDYLVYDGDDLYCYTEKDLTDSYELEGGK